MNDQQPAILHCPKCKERKDNINLGSITSEGYLIVKRQFGRMTMVMSKEYSVICDCGYFIRIHDGRITADAYTGNRMNE